MLQAVASEDKRSHLGMHYTSVPNIMKVIKPLFLDDLRAEFKNARGDSDRLNRLLVRMGKIKFMDPACGSGNFLIITYKELRRLEMDIYEELGKINGSMIYTSSIDLGQFYGIEIEDFAVDVTRLSLYIADHQMNLELKRRYGDYLRETLPLHKVGDIRCGNALRLNWDKILPHDKDDEVYLFGNPPYLGARDQKDYHKKDMEYIFSKKIKLFKNLDYISGWFYLATKYIYKSNAKFAFVTTNSICQGVQVGILWPKLLDEVEISFAYTPFNWGNNAKKNANVIISIIGCRNYSSDKKLLYSNDKYKIVRNISPYLAEGSNEVVIAERKPLQGLPNMLFGNMANDGGYLIFDQKRYDNLPMSVKKLTKPLIGSKEYIRGSKRYCLWLYKISDREYENNDFIMDLLKKVREHRLKSKRTATKKLAESPELFGEIRYEKSNFVFIPEVSSENREYVPMGYFSDYSVVVAPNLQIYDAPLWLLGLLESRMHMLWLKNIGGTLGTSFRYSATLVYNTFPVPELSTRRKNEIEELIGNILDIREEEGGTLAELYGSPLAAKNPKPMNPRLLEAHKELDKVVDRAYKSTDFKDDNERLALLLNMYSEMVNKKG